MVYNPEVTIKVSYGCYQWYSSSGGTEQSVIICPGMEKSVVVCESFTAT